MMREHVDFPAALGFCPTSFRERRLMETELEKIGGPPMSSRASCSLRGRRAGESRLPQLPRAELATTSHPVFEHVHAWVARGASTHVIGRFEDLAPIGSHKPMFTLHVAATGN